jgi:hypothetical protein
MGYKEDIQIDIHTLDAEWIKQASLYQYYARKEAVALYERDQLADKLALTQAQLDGDIRLNFKKHGFDSKPTEAAILNSIKQNPFYIKANSLLMKASCKAKIIGGAVRAFDHKKKALEKLTDLYLSGYWASPKIKSEAQEVYGKQVHEGVEVALKKDDRMIAVALKKESERKLSLCASAHQGRTVKQEAAAGVDGAVAAEKKRLAAIEKKKLKPKAAVEKKKAGDKTKPGSKPIGKTEEQIRHKPKGANKKKK